jgi:hypothetical protein
MPEAQLAEDVGKTPIGRTFPAEGAKTRIMSGIRVVDVQTHRDRKAFVKFPMRLFADCPYFVPPLIVEELATFSPKKNPAFEMAEARLFLAYKGDEIVGRVAAILSHAANGKNQTKNVRFGWFDTINDLEVASGLLGAVESWARERGMLTVTGPQGFDEFDKAGMLTEGFESLPTMATYYNYPYYNDLLDRCGYTKDIDSVEYLVRSMTEFPARLRELAQKLMQRGKYRVVEFKTRRELMRRGDEILSLLQEAYWDLYDYVPMTPRQRAHYIKKFLPVVNPQLVKTVVTDGAPRHVPGAADGDEMVGFFIAVPSLSAALRKANGRLFPFGIYHLWKAMRPGNPLLDFGLAGVKKAHRGRGVDLLMGLKMFESANKLGFKQAESNPELETNLTVQREWRVVDHIIHRRRRIYKKVL